MATTTGTGAPLWTRIVAPAALVDAGAHMRVTEWLDEIGAGDGGHGANLARIMASKPSVRALIETIASGSPYLWDLVRADPARLVALIEDDPDRRLATRLSETARAVSECVSDTEAMRLLRVVKAEAALLIALADIGGVWDVTRVTAALTAVADMAVAAAARFLVGEAARAGRMAPPDPGDPERGSGLVVLAMGKMGAGELNYSSDIDLMVFFDPQAPALASGIEPGVLFVRMTQRLIKLLQQRTADGYVFRVDLRLRPDPASTQVAISVPAALDYYESRGRNWERAALIKARVAAGDRAAGAALLRELSPFIWRKYLDYVALGDIHDMKRQIHAFRGHGVVAVEGHNIKLGRGGIREIEFFAQTQQLIAGGRHPQLRSRETLVTLRALAEGGWIDERTRGDLDAAYRFLRMIEHRLQMIADEQTHVLPQGRDALDRFARFAGFADRDALAASLLVHLRAVESYYAGLFEHAGVADAARRRLAFPADADDKETLAKLNAMGFRNPLEASSTVRDWLAGAPRGLKGASARAHFADIVPVLVEHFAKAENPDAVLLAFDRFLANLGGGGARLFSLLRQSPDLIALVARVLGTAPRLADTLAQHPDILATLIEPAFFGPLPDSERLAADLARSLDLAGSYEDYLDRVRQFGQEQNFLIGARVLSGTVSAQQAGAAFAGVADAIVRALHRKVAETFAAVHGLVPGGETAVLAMGKLGGREMTATSDLDLILVYDFDPSRPDSDGPRPLHATQYFARLTQRLINALTTPTNYGRLYHVDMRLRPSGRSGPVATAIASFENYQHNEAWTWEHMALTRARVVSAPPALAKRVDTVIRNVLRAQRDVATVRSDVVEMRRAIAAEKGDAARWDLKYAAGGLVDIEFVAQYLELIHAAAVPDILDTATAAALEKAARLGILGPDDAEILRPAVRLYQDLDQLLRLCVPAPFDPKSAGASLAALLARAADVPDFATLEAHLVDTQRRVRNSFIRVVGAAP